MPEHPAVFRYFGILPDQLQPPQPLVRGFLSPARIAGQYLASGLVVAFGLALAGLLAWAMPRPLNWLGCFATLAGFGSIVYLMTRNDYGTIELEGDTLRARHLYTGRVVRRQAKEIECLVTVFHPGEGLQAAVTEHLLGRIKGVEVQFRDKRSPLRILRSDPAMTNAQELIEGILYRMSQIAELAPEIADQNGLPLVRSIHWKGAGPSPRPKPIWQLSGCLLIVLGLVSGPILGCAGEQQEDLLEVSSQPAHEIPLGELIKNGPGANRHITITEFQADGYVYEADKNSGHWTQVWVACFPAAGRGNEIEAIVSSKSISGEAMLQQMLRQSKITGACSAKKRTSWGVTLGPELSKANQNLPLKAAWELQELRTPPSREVVQALFIGSYACLGLVLLLALCVLGSAAVASISG